VTDKFVFPTVSEALPVICARLLEAGDEVGSRNGRVKELLNPQVVITDPMRREILTLNRKANVFAQIAETMWVLAGRNDIEWLSAYLPRAMDYSDDGKTWRAAYGRRIRHWNCDPGWEGIDQLAYVVDMLRADPLSRQAVINIWDPSVDTTPGKDKACNDFIQFQSRLGALHMTVTVRSNDVMWGWSGINAFEWSTLQEIVAHLLGITVGTLTFNIGSLHLYAQHWNKGGRLEYEPDPHAIIPFLMPNNMDRTLVNVDLLVDQWFAWESKCRAGEATPEGLDEIKEPMLNSWASAIAYFWTGEDYYLRHLFGTALAVAVARTPARTLSEARTASRSGTAAPTHNLAAHERTGAFYTFVKDLHATKHTSYGDSWKKRGEKMSILANMARKVDRLGVGDQYDSAADTLIDLLVYTLKYRLWLVHEDDGPDNLNYWLSWFLAEEEETVGQAVDIAIVDIVDDFNRYCDNIDDIPLEQKNELMTELARRITPIARDVWYKETHDIDEYRGADAD
jgi:thymidylate synthase